MQEKVEKYIYYIRDNYFRIKFKRIVKDNTINFDEYFDGTIEEAVSYRDKKLAEYGLSLEKEKFNGSIFDEIELKSKPEKTNKKQKEKTIDTDKYNQPKKANAKEVLVDKYIYQLGKNKFRVRIKIGNKSNPNSIDFSKTINGTLAEARKIRDKKLAEYKLGVGGSPKSTIKFYDFAKIWYTEYCLKELSPSTWRTNELSLKNYVFPFIGNVPLNKIDALMIQKMINSLKEQKKARPEKDGTYKTLSLTTVNGAYRLVRKILNKAVAWDYLDKNPVNKVKAPGDAKTEKESFNKKELLEILELLSKEPAVRKTMFTICICTGVRRCELLGLHLDDIDFKKKTIRVCRSAVWNKLEQKVTEKETKTKGSVREIPIPDFCLKAIEEYLVHRDRQVKRFKKVYGKDFDVPKNIFLSVEGKIMNPSTATSLWNKFRKKYPHLKDVSLHGLRHSYCSMQMNENDKLSPSDVAKIMGHSQLTTTYRYTHSNEDKTEDAISIFYDEQKAPYRTFNFNQVLSVITGRKYASTNEINDLLDYVFPNSVDVPINERLSQVKEAILDDYPNLENISDDGLNVTNIWDWLEEKKNEYGDKFAISAEIVAIKNNTLEL